MTVSTVEAASAAKEVRRWMVWLTGSLVAGSICTGLALAGAGAWFLFGAIIAGPGVGGFALVWLAITSDTNAEPKAIADTAPAAVAEAAA